jgi:hypothetical protein
MINFNNILLTHKGVDVSVIQHRDKDNPMDTQYQEIGIGEPSVDMPIIRYASTLDEFIDALQKARYKIEQGQEHEN